MKKLTRLFFAALALVLALTLFGCAAAPAEPSPTAEPTPEPTSTPVPEVNVPVQDIADQLLAMEDMFPSAMGFMGEEMITESCGLDFSLLSEYSLNDPMMNVHAHMLYVAKVKDEADVPAVEEAFGKRLTLMQDIFSTYLPAQYDLAMAGQVVSNGKYVLMVVSNDSQAVVDEFNRLLTAE
ncbi:MAG: DUF4358 domain-containing protein [Candidatus Spyradocola sp.]|nr:DUF4358 domain-containing protein [Candidatus Spyradocola sp.]